MSNRRTARAPQPRTLTLNDLALAQFACAHAINRAKAGGRSKFWRNERASFEALNRKLSAIQDRAEPLSPQDGEFSNVVTGDEAVMRLDFAVIRKLHKRARIRKGARP